MSSRDDRTVYWWVFGAERYLILAVPVPVYDLQLGALGVQHLGDAVGQQVEGHKVHDVDGERQEEVRRQQRVHEVLSVERVHEARRAKDHLDTLPVPDHLLSRPGAVGVVARRLHEEDLRPGARPAARCLDVHRCVDVVVVCHRLAVHFVVVLEVDCDLHAGRAEVGHVGDVARVLLDVVVERVEVEALAIERDQLLERQQDLLARRVCTTWGPATPRS